MSVLVNPGENIPLNLQLSDGEESLPKLVKSFIRDAFGVLQASVELTHIGDGLFLDNSSFLMPPDGTEIYAQYIVYELDGTTRDIFFPITYETYQNTATLNIGSSSSSSNNFSDAGAITVVVEEQPIQEISIIVETE